jgi:redox-sensitive bicupin YhaK (pirin superfamily)
MPATTTRPYLILAPEDHAALGESEFGMPGLLAIESIGPFTEIEASGPLITVHDATVTARLGIGHHPHRYNERLFYIEQGELDHDDAANNIQGHIGTGDVGQFTEGQSGMLHSEWNNGDTDTRAYILIYSTDPIPESASFNVLRDSDAPRYDEGTGAHTKELVGPRSPLQVNGDIRSFADSRLDPAAELTLRLDANEGGLISIREGIVDLVADERILGSGVTIIAPPSAEPGTLLLRARQPSRIIRVVHGPGHGFLRGEPRLRTRTTIRN